MLKDEPVRLFFEFSLHYFLEVLTLTRSTQILFPKENQTSKYNIKDKKRKEVFFYEKNYHNHLGNVSKHSDFSVVVVLPFEL